MLRASLPPLPQANHPIISIARCPNFVRGPVAEHPCNTILSKQGHIPLPDRQVPEPFRGSFQAPLLFVASNPSIDVLDDSPQVSDSDAHITDYYAGGFPSCFPKIRMKTGQPSARAVSFWSSIRARAAEAWGMEPADIIPGRHFAITEIVHCKSIKERGVAEALPECMRLYLQPILTSSAATVVIALGRIAHGALGITPGQLTRSASGRLTAGLPHPSSWREAKKISSFYNAQHLDDIRRALHPA